MDMKVMTESITLDLLIIISNVFGEVTSLGEGKLWIQTC